MAGTNGQIHLFALLIELHGAGPMSLVITLQRNYFLAGANLKSLAIERIAFNGFGFGNIEVLFPDRHAKRPIQIFQQFLFRFVWENCNHASFGNRIGNQHCSTRSLNHVAWLLEPGREFFRLESCRQIQLLAIRLRN